MHRYQGAIAVFVAILLGFLLVVTMLISLQQESLLAEMTRTRTTAMLDLMSDAFYEALLKSDYVTIGNFIERWGESHPDLLRVRAVAPNGFVVGEFERTFDPGTPSYSLAKQILHKDRLLLTIELAGNYHDVQIAVTGLRNRLMVSSVIFTALLGAALWYSQRRMALLPLEREITLRKHAEEELLFAQQELETKVRERTAELEHELAERRRVEAELVMREERIHLLLNSTAEGIYGVDTLGNCIFCNPSGLQMLGFEREADVLGRQMHGLIHYKKPDGTGYAEDACTIYRAYRTGQGCHNDREVFWRPDGSHFPVEYWSFPIVNKGTTVGAVVTFIDISERRRLEAQLLQSQKMEAIGTLAGGVAHDFNNILTAIIGYGSMLQRKMPDDDRLKPNVANILEAAQRAARLTKNLLTFSRKQALAPLPVDLNSIVRRMEKLITPLIGEDVELQLDLSDEDLIVMADSGQMEQVLMNFAANARDAMPKGGSFTLRSEPAAVDESQARLQGLPASGLYAILSVSDTGTGMDEETRRKIFEPFFTTKEVGKGTGLGLSIAYGIIKQHHGMIGVYSEQGKGSTFKIYIPLLNDPVARDHVVLSKTPAAGGPETILIAEDDRSVREMMCAVLRESGYTVMEAADGDDAVRLFAERRNDIHMVLLDTIMPKKNGKEAYEAMKIMQPDIRVLFMSGYTADIIDRKGLLGKGFDLLQKPVSPSELLLEVRKALDR